MANPTGFLTNVGETGAGYGAATAETFPVVVGKIIGVFLTLMGAIFLILIIYGGFTWMTASGEPEKIKKAQQIIKNAIIGLIIVLAANVITQFILQQIIFRLEGTAATGA